jgi:hypothetical protein
MVPLLFLGHAALTVLLVATRRSVLSDGITRFASVLGMALGIATVIARTSDETWRTTLLDPSAGSLGGVAVACAWLVAGTLDPSEPRWRAAALVGIASTGLLMFAANLWVVPALLFWLCSSLALAAMARERRDGSLAWLTLLVTDGALVVGLIAHALDTESWRLPTPVRGWELWVIAGAAILRSGAVARLGTWSLLAPQSAPALPLAVGGAFAIVAGPASSARPWLGLTLVVAALVVALWATTGRRVMIAIVGAWPAGLALGASFVAPEAATGAGVVAILTVTVAALWTQAAGRAQVERAAVFSFVPLTAGFGLVAAAASVAFVGATKGSGVIESPSWAAIAAVLPATLAAGVALAVRIGRQRRSDDFQSEAVLATWGVAAVALGLGLLPRVAVGLGGVPLGAVAGEVWLYVVALLLGAGTAWLVGRRGGRAEIAAAHDEVVLGLVALPDGASRALAWCVAPPALGVAGAVGWFTIEGLQAGFL